MQKHEQAGFIGSLRNLLSGVTRRRSIEHRAEDRRSAEGILTLLTGQRIDRPDAAEVELLDVSANGIAFMSDVECWMGQHLCLTDGRNLAELEVISRAPFSKERFRYGCRFVDWGYLPQEWTRYIPRSEFDLGAAVESASAENGSPQSGTPSTQS